MTRGTPQSPEPHALPQRLPYCWCQALCRVDSLLGIPASPPLPALSLCTFLHSCGCGRPAPHLQISCLPHVPPHPRASLQPLMSMCLGSGKLVLIQWDCWESGSRSSCFPWGSPLCLIHPRICSPRRSEVSWAGRGTQCSDNYPLWNESHVCLTTMITPYQSFNKGRFRQWRRWFILAVRCRIRRCQRLYYSFVAQSEIKDASLVPINFAPCSACYDKRHNLCYGAEMRNITCSNFHIQLVSGFSSGSQCCYSYSKAVAPFSTFSAFILWF